MGIKKSQIGTVAAASPAVQPAVTIEDEGTPVETSLLVMDFTGAGVTSTQSSPGNVDVAIPGAAPGSERSIVNPIVTPATPMPYLAMFGETIICDLSAAPGTLITIQLPPTPDPSFDGLFVEVKNMSTTPGGGTGIQVVPDPGSGVGGIDLSPVFVFPVLVQDLYGVKFRVANGARPGGGPPVDFWAAILHFHADGDYNPYLPP